NDYGASSLVAKGRLPWRSGNGALTVDARGLSLGIAMDSARVDARGAVEDFELEGVARGEPGVLALAGNAQRNANGWQGTLASLRLEPTLGAAWRLQAPAQFSQRGNAFTLSQSCFATEGGGQGSLCASADWPRQGLSVLGQGLPLSLLAPYLPAREHGQAWVLRGV